MQSLRQTRLPRANLFWVKTLIRSNQRKGKTTHSVRYPGTDELSNPDRLPSDSHPIFARYGVVESRTARHTPGGSAHC